MWPVAPDPPVEQVLSVVGDGCWVIITPSPPRTCRFGRRCPVPRFLTLPVAPASSLRAVAHSGGVWYSHRALHQVLIVTVACPGIVIVVVIVVIEGWASAVIPRVIFVVPLPRSWGSWIFSVLVVLA
jgi:hypothetical protein